MLAESKNSRPNSEYKSFCRTHRRAVPQLNPLYGGGGGADVKYTKRAAGWLPQSDWLRTSDLHTWPPKALLSATRYGTDKRTDSLADVSIPVSLSHTHTHWPYLG